MKKSTKIILISLAVIILIVICLFIPTIVESVYFNKVTSASTPAETVAACDRYMNKCPNGKHVEDVLFIKICKCEDSQETIKALDRYIDQYPNSEEIPLFEIFREYLLSNPEGTFDEFKASIRNRIDQDSAERE